MRATSTTLENNRIKLTVEVDEAEMDEAIDAAATTLSKQMSVKGFRKGKVPKSVHDCPPGWSRRPAHPRQFASHCPTFTRAPSPTR